MIQGFILFYVVINLGLVRADEPREHKLVVEAAVQELHTLMKHWLDLIQNDSFKKTYERKVSFNGKRLKMKMAKLSEERSKS